MVNRSTFSPGFAAVLGIALAACSNGSVGDAAPRLATIPPQSTAGGTTFQLDLGNFVTDREGGTLTYEVVDGGGDFTGSVYSQLFPAMGQYEVAFRVTDPQGKAADGTFSVEVTSSEFVVVREDNSGLRLLDAASEQMITVAASAPTPSFAAGLADGRLVYQLASGTDQLWVFDPMTRRNTRVAATATGDVTFHAVTSDGDLVLTTGTPADTDLFVYEPRTGLLREVSAQIGEVDGNPIVNTEDLVFYERGSLGQADIFYYDPTTDESTPVSTAPTGEHLLAALPDGGVVFSRVGGTGETDLFYFKRGVGLVEIAGSVAGLVDLDKTYAGFGSGSQVVFTAANVADRDLWFWNPADGQATPIATGAVFGFEAVAAGNEVVYRHEVSGSEHDLFFYDLDDATTATVRDGADVSQLLAVTTDGTTSWAIVLRTGAPANVDAVSLVGTPATVTLVGGATKEFQAVLGNGDVVVRSADGTGFDVFGVAGAAWTSLAGTGIVFAGPGVDAGDFVFSMTVSAQTDLHLWDSSAATPVTISDTTGDDVYQATQGGKVFFTRDTVGNADLFVWDPSDLSTEQLTTLDANSLAHDYAALGTFSGSR